MARFEPVSSTAGVFYADYSTAILLPNASGQPLVSGYEVVVFDNLQLSGANPIVISCPLAQNETSVTLATAGGAYKFKWTGSFYAMGV